MQERPRLKYKSFNVFFLSINSTLDLKVEDVYVCSSWILEKKIPKQSKYLGGGLRNSDEKQKKYLSLLTFLKNNLINPIIIANVLLYNVLMYIITFSYQMV